MLSGFTMSFPDPQPRKCPGRLSIILAYCHFGFQEQQNIPSKRVSPEVTLIQDGQLVATEPNFGSHFSVPTIWDSGIKRLGSKYLHSWSYHAEPYFIETCRSGWSQIYYILQPDNKRIAILLTHPPKCC